ncbi:MAG: AAA family ATPase, partial [Candidatus Baldrarchaeia archaeon]
MSNVGEIAVNKLIELNNLLCDMFVQREFEILGALSGLLTGEPVIFVGVPGTAKTNLVETISNAIQCKYFYYLLHRFTEPDELLGPLDINAIRQGRYVRITANRLPDAEIIFLDEIFKGSSAIRNLLLDIILNKRYLNGTEYKKLPMLAFYSASNEISTDAEDMAFYDRLLIRNFVRNVSEDRWEDLLIKGIEIEDVEVNPIMSKEDVIYLQNLTKKRFKALKNNRTIISKYLLALTSLKSLGIELSDRRKVKVLKVVSAISILYVEERPSLNALADALRLCAVHTEDDREKVEQVILQNRI